MDSGESSTIDNNDFLPALILRNLIHNEEYCRKVIPFLKDEYFSSRSHKLLFGEIDTFLNKYNELPSKDAIVINLSKNKELKNRDLALETATLVKYVFKKTVDEDAIVSKNSEANHNWIVEETEKFCQEKAILNAIIHSVEIIDGKDENFTPHAIPKILQDALGVSFSTAIGHDYIEDAEQRFEFYNTTEDRIKFDIDILNWITNGGVPDKTLNLFLLETGGGKTLILCYLAAMVLMRSKNVLYITMEMAEEKIASRIDANLFGVPLSDIEGISHDLFTTKMGKIIQKTMGKLIIKEYPTGAAHVGHFRALLAELKIKKNFVPDVIFIDYLGICASSRIKSIGGSIGSYAYMKAVAEELRGLGIECKVPVFSGIQTNRDGLANSDAGLKSTSESVGIAFTADLILQGYVNDELAARGQMLFTQLKNRYGPMTYYPKFLVGLDRPRMRLYNLDDSANPHQEKNVSGNPINVGSNDELLDSGFIDFKV